MKLASLKHGPDGRLVVVSDDLAWCAAPPPAWPTLQAALDDWQTAGHPLPALKAATTPDMATGPIAACPLTDDQIAKADIR